MNFFIKKQQQQNNNTLLALFRILKPSFLRDDKTGLLVISPADLS